MKAKHSEQSHKPLEIWWLLFFLNENENKASIQGG